MYPVWVILVVVLFSLFMIINGLLLCLSPDIWIRFYDWYTPGDYVSKIAPWRNEIHGWEFKLLGTGMVCFGSYFIEILLRNIVKSYLC